MGSLCSGHDSGIESIRRMTPSYMTRCEYCDCNVFHTVCM